MTKLHDQIEANYLKGQEAMLENAGKHPLDGKTCATCRHFVRATSICANPLYLSEEGQWATTYPDMCCLCYDEAEMHTVQFFHDSGFGFSPKGVPETLSIEEIRGRLTRALRAFERGASHYLLAAFTVPENKEITIEQKENGK